MSSKKSNHAQGRGANRAQTVGKASRRAAQGSKAVEMVASQPSALLTRSVGLGVAVARSGIPHLATERAPPHDEYPEGGVRVIGCLPGSSETSQVTNDTAALGGWSVTGVGSAVLCPTGSAPTATSFSVFSSTGPLAAWSQYFRQYRFRKLIAEYTPVVSPGNTTEAAKLVQFAYERDPVTAEQNSGSYTIDTAVTSSECHRDTAWVPRTVPLVMSGRASRDDKLFYTTGAGDVLAVTSDAEMRQAYQGAITCVVSSVAAADVVLGKVLWHFVVDLYGFTNITTGVLPLRSYAPRLKYGAGRSDEPPEVADEKSAARQRRRAELMRELASLAQ